MWSLATKKQPPKLFRAAITSSTYPGFQYRYNGRIPQNLFNEVAAEAGCNATKPLDCLCAADGATFGRHLECAPCRLLWNSRIRPRHRRLVHNAEPNEGPSPWPC
ncbi:hypothetical protein DFH06DRAFT_1178629 [Mycena polygramma]|nr:hypothetical protein DFH06DRAFT_1178629 [Mycena polygramma]